MIHIVCIGNLLEEDDGFGIHIFRRLTQIELPEHVKVFVAGTAGFNALGYFENCRKVIIVDALDSGLPVGTVSKFPLDDPGPAGNEFSLHAAGLDQLLAILPVVMPPDELPQVVVVGAQIGRIIPFTNALSNQLQSALETTITLIQEEIRNYQDAPKELVGSL